MYKNYIKLLSLILAMLIICGMAGACHNSNSLGEESNGKINNGSSSDDSNGADTETDTPAVPVTVVDNGNTDYAIVLQSDLKESETINAAVNELRNAFRTYMAVDIPILSDTNFSGSSDLPVILIGNIEKADYGDIPDMLRINDYYVGLRGKQIVIFAKNEESLEKAINYFTNKIVIAQGKQGTTLKISVDDTYWKKEQYTMSSIIIGDKEVSYYRIVVSSKASVAELNIANDLRYNFFSKYGTMMELVTDAEAEKEYEIIIGNTSRSSINADTQSYRIALLDHKLYVLASGMPGCEAALAYLKQQLFGGTKTQIPEGFTHSGSADEGLNDASVLSATGDVRVMFYNIQGHNDSASSNLRRDMQIEIFRTYQPDVLAFQEFHKRSRLNGFVEQLSSLNYAEVRVELPAANKHNNNYTPIFYRTDKLTVVDSGYHLYTGLNDSYSKGLTWALFRDKTTGKQFIVISTHYWWELGGAEHPENDAARVEDSKQLLNIISQIYAKHKDTSIPLIAGGDMNCVFQSEAVSELLNNGLTSAWVAAEKKNDSGGHHQYAEYNEDFNVFSKWDTPTAAYQTGWSLDHVFVRNVKSVSLFQTLLDRYALICSDHCPVMVDVRL